MTFPEEVLESIKLRIFNTLESPEHWEDEGIACPNMECKKKSFDIAAHLLYKYVIEPSRIAPTIEEGILLAYDSSSGDKTLSIEVYNDLSAGYLLNDNVNKRIILSEDIVHYDFDTVIRRLEEGNEGEINGM